MAFEFNGTNQSITGSITVTSVPLTIAGIFSPASSVYQVLTVLDAATNSDANRQALWAMGADAGTPIRAQSRAVSSTSNADSTAAYVAAAFNACAAVFFATNSRAAFVDGQNKGTNTGSISSITLNNIRIGRQVDNTFLLNGKASEVAVWTAALTDAEIASLGKGFKPYRVRPQSLLFYAPLIRTLQDTKGGLALTNNNSATVADHPRVY